MQPKRGPGITELRSAFLLISNKMGKLAGEAGRREEGKKKFYHQSSKYACSQSGFRENGTRSAFLLVKTIKWENWPVRREEGKKEFYHQSSKYACSQSGSRDNRTLFV